MKKLFVAIITIAVIVGSMSGVNQWFNTYEKDCRVTGVNGNIVQVIDNHGDIWTFEDNEKYYTEGETITVQFTQNGTDPIEDDEIIGVK